MKYIVSILLCLLLTGCAGLELCGITGDGSYYCPHANIQPGPGE